MQVQSSRRPGGHSRVPWLLVELLLPMLSVVTRSGIHLRVPPDDLWQRVLRVRVHGVRIVHGAQSDRARHLVGWQLLLRRLQERSHEVPDTPTAENQRRVLGGLHDPLQLAEHVCVVPRSWGDLCGWLQRGCVSAPRARWTPRSANCTSSSDTASHRGRACTSTTKRGDERSEASYASTPTAATTFGPPCDVSSRNRQCSQR